MRSSCGKGKRQRCQIDAQQWRLNKFVQELLPQKGLPPTRLLIVRWQGLQGTGASACSDWLNKKLKREHTPSLDLRSRPTGGCLGV
mmetsp:Transcript_73036/g.201553  ORF Transcript_73036/g.201553 Transcript_73036/m.201553 type:complete len:86 (-) Transcript_73036:116-373(-)